MEIITKSAQETKNLGRQIGASLTHTTPVLRGARVLALIGDLGSGKTTFVQGLARGLGIKSKIISPTFILLRQYGNFYHVDLYRLEKNLEQEVKNLGLDDIWEGDNIVVIEWAEKIKDLLPQKTIWIKFENLGEDKRKISIND